MIFLINHEDDNRIYQNINTLDLNKNFEIALSCMWKASDKLLNRKNTGESAIDEHR